MKKKVLFVLVLFALVCAGMAFAKAEKCSKCDGKKKYEDTCYRCWGSGKAKELVKGKGIIDVKCEGCKGKGKMTFTCDWCDGKGKIGQLGIPSGLRLTFAHDHAEANEAQRPN